MCGRVRLPEDWSEIRIVLRLDKVIEHDYRPIWNVPPTERLPVVTSKEGARTLAPMRWGLVPSWAKDIKVGFSSFNARADSVDTKPAFRGAWQGGRRCLVVTAGFYEWRKPDKQPFAVALGNRGPMIMAGLWDFWKDPEGKWLRSCTIITTDANELIAPLHNRMPVVLEADAWPGWLGEAKATEVELKGMLKPYASERMALWPVDRKVGNVRNEGRELAEPIALAG